MELDPKLPEYFAKPRPDIEMIPASPNTVLFSETNVPSFILKLWKLVDDGKYEQSIGWDESGLTFRIKEPYKFSLEILPQYFKHSNLNSFVRQLNMYGFRKVNSLERGSMKPPPEQGEPLEFQHPYFVRQRPELLDLIRRRTPSAKINSHSAVQPKLEAQPSPLASAAIVLSESLPQNTVVIDGQQYLIQTVPATNQAQPFVEMATTPNPSTSYDTATSKSQDLSAVFIELKRMRDRQVVMDQKLQHMEAENQTLWREVAHMRVKHMKQQEIVDKLFKFLLIFANQRTSGGPSNQGAKIPLGKRPMLAIGETVVTKLVLSEKIC
uniref:HSF-type DNA-binding domain-containing protein n=1 Tax=Romanomermis culicivorax TaxID=13658 RepID=A0A915KID1_ROMCU